MSPLPDTASPTDGARAAAKMAFSERLRDALAAGKSHAALRMISSLFAQKSRFALFFETVIEAFEAEGQAAALAGLLLENPETPVFDRLPWAAKAARLSLNAGKLGFFKEIAARRAGAPARLRFSEFDYITICRGTHPYASRDLRYDPAFAEDLFRLKYADIPNPGDVEALIRNARLLARRMDMGPQSLQYLFDRRANRDQPFAEWQAEVGCTRAIRHLVFDAAIPPESLSELFDPDAERAAKAAVDTSDGALILVCHASQPDARKAFLRAAWPETIYMTGLEPRPGFIPIGDAATAVFAGLKVLKSKGVIALAMDGQRGGRRRSINVLGRISSVGDGAAFLAYESGCATLWFAMHRRGDRFVPNAVPGPRRKAGEAFVDFETRLVAFYERMMTELCAGDPQDLVLSQRWIKVFAGA